MDLPATLGDFQLHAILGAGGSGVVYDAEWGPRHVALKVLHPHLVHTERERAQFFAEAQRLAAIGHPSVVKVLAVGALPDGRPYLAMERLAGETLASVLARGPLAVGPALALFDELAGAVAALHAQGLVHRDLKPENVFVVAAKHAVLLDFGIAKEISGAASTVTQDGGVRGTPAYMAPERFFGQPAGVATDVYELAVIFYAMLAGRLPWDDLVDPEARLQPRPLGDLVSGVPEEVDVELRRALSTRAANRPESATALAAAVRAAASGAAAPAPREPTSAETAPMSKEAVNRAAAGAAGGTLSSAPARPWFAERAPTTDRGKTPLAWAPTEAAPPEAPAPARARRGRAIAAGLTAVAGGAGVVVFALGGSPAPAADAPAAALAVTPAPATGSAAPRPTVAPADDPWGAPHPSAPSALVATPGSAAEPAAPTLATTGAPRAPAAYRAEAAAALGHLPADTKSLITVDVNQIMDHAAFAKLVHTAVDDFRVTALLTMAPPCARALVAASDWAAFGAPSLGDSQHGSLLVGGRWTTADVAACFHATPEAGARGVWRIREFGYLTQVDAHVALLTNRDDLAPPALAALAAHGGAAPAAIRAAVTALPADRAIGFVLDASSGDDLSSTLDLPRGTGVAGALRVEADGVRIDATADPHDEAAAAAVEAKAAPQLAQLTLFGDLTITRKGSALRIAGRLSDGFLSALAASSLSK